MYVYLILLCFADTVLFYSLNICSNPASRKPTGASFSIAFVHFMSVCHILIILTIFQTFSLLLYLLCGDRSLIFDVIIVILLGDQKTHPYKMANSIDKCCGFSDCSPNRPLLCLSPSSWGHYSSPSLPLPLGRLFLETIKILKLGQLKTLQWLLRVKVKGRVTHLSL